METDETIDTHTYVNVKTWPFG